MVEYFNCKVVVNVDGDLVVSPVAVPLRRAGGHVVCIDSNGVRQVETMWGCQDNNIGLKLPDDVAYILCSTVELVHPGRDVVQCGIKDHGCMGHYGGPDEHHLENKGLATSQCLWASSLKQEQIS